MNLWLHHHNWLDGGCHRLGLYGLGLRADGFLEGGIRQIKARSHFHLVRVAELVDADQAGHWKLVGLGDLRKSLPFGNGVFGGSRDRGYGHWLEGRARHDCVAGESQGLTDFHVVGVTQVVEGHQVATTDPVLAGNAAEGLTAVDAMASRARRHGGAWHLQAASSLDKVWVADPIHPHQGADADAVAVSDIRERLAGSHRHRGSCG